MKRLVVLPDLHCGHNSGLTPPDWQDTSPSNKYLAMQRDCWKWYWRKAAELKPIDILVINGDAIEGKAPKQGGRELITADRDEQIEIAKKCIEIWDAKEIYMTYGTGYHTGTEEDWESPLARELGAIIKGHLWLNIEDVIFDIKHRVGASIIPHGRYTALAREALWNALWAEIGGQPRANVFIRSHVHYFVYCGDDRQLCIIMPALKTLGDIYGIRHCVGIVDYGLVHFDCEDGAYIWQPHIKKYNAIISDRVIMCGEKTGGKNASKKAKC